MKATTSQMSHARPFRWRRKHQGESIRGTQEPEHNNNYSNHQQQHQYLTLRSSAIGQHHEHHHHRHNHHLLSHELNNMGNMNVCGSPRPIEATETLPTTTITHSQRYSLPLQSPPPSSSTAATPLRITSHRRRRGGRLSSSPVTPAFSLPMLMSLSIIACVILSLLNLTIDQMQPKMVVAIGANGAASSSSSSSSPATAAAAGATPSLSQSTATLQRQQQQQQQQSNSVIQYSSATAPTTITKAKYKTMYACEDRQLTMDCETGSKINLIRANFGRFSITQCNEQGQLDLSTDCMSPITFRIMQERCQDRQRCSVNATSVLFGDRCPKTRKYLEVHFQCQIIEPDTVDLRTPSPLPKPTPNPPMPTFGPGVPKPPNNPTLPTWRQPTTNPAEETPNQLFTPVINSQVMTPAMALSIGTPTENKLTDFYPGHNEQVIVSLAHLQVDNMARPRCYQWDPTSRQWTDRGARIVETNQTHTICAFDQQTSYVLVMDYSGPMPPISPSKQPAIQLPPIHEPQPIEYPQPEGTASDRGTPNPPDGSEDVGKMIHPPTSDTQSKQQQPASFSARLFLYLVGIVFVAVALMTLTFVASSMRSSAGAALKSLGNFAPFSGPKYKQRRHNGDPPSLHSNKDLLVINNSNGHSFIYAPASTTKISSSSSTHILSTGQPVGLSGQQQQHQAGTLHRLQQQQMYSGNGATLSSLSGTGAQSNNYYYGLMGLNPLLQQQQQQQQQQHHFSQHHLDQSQAAQQAQQQQLVGHQQQQQQVNTATTASYNRQANKSSVSNESANSSASSSGVESGSTSMQQQQQQARTQQACLVSAMNNNDFHLMGHHISNYGQHQPHQQQQHNLFATLKGASVTHQPHQHQPTFTVNAHYSTSGGINNLVGNGVTGAGMQSINVTQNQAAAATMLHNRQASQQMRDHIYECVDDDKPYMARLLMPTPTNSQHQIFGSPSFMSTRRTAPNECNTRQK